jgi:pseudaminic acid biosynthesis-associated methylase
MSNEGLAFWAGEFGDEYTRRNQVDWRARIPFWQEIMHRTGARSAFEVGCNAGWNLSAIRAASSLTTVVGTDINVRACEQAAVAGLTVFNQLDFTAVPRKAELVFTAGLLIHIEPEHLGEVMCALVDKSYRWVLAIEYGAREETPIEYRGHKDKCWKRPYGELYTNLGLTRVDYWSTPLGFDRCQAWLMEK